MARGSPYQRLKQFSLRSNADRMLAFLAMVCGFVVYFSGMLTNSFDFPIVSFFFGVLVAVVLFDCLFRHRHVVAGVAIVVGLAIYTAGGVTATFRFPIIAYLSLVFSVFVVVEYLRDRGWL